MVAMANYEEQMMLYRDYLLSERQYSKKTAQAYLSDIQEFVHFFDQNGGFKQFSKIDRFDVRIFLNRLYEMHLAKSTIARKISSLRTFYGFLLDNDLLTQNPFFGIEFRSKNKKLPQFLYPNEILDYLHSAGSLEDAEHLRDLALVELLYASGMRIFELTNLTFPQIDFANRMLNIIGKGNKQRIIPFGKPAAQALQKYFPWRQEQMTKFGQQHDFVFINTRGRQMTETGAEYILKQISKRSTLTGSVHPHMLRHSFATHMLNNGADIRTVQELLGHASLSTTQIYTHITTKNLQESYEKFFDRAKIKHDD
ncbi:tyrosine recombinase XerC [Oenococcus kitaharae]|uniref:Tyrosine recombinase XerC n=1 Tax=Oenococcus kitaharae DSM 17330 TaxID=1045004 RepID=G9WFY3_9LACO|nr:Site-specific tyrosine recombinase [Oenococcus kitaharae DSM 17330]